MNSSIQELDSYSSLNSARFISQPISLNDCPHKKLINYNKRTNCYKCGLNIPKDKSIQSYKTNSFKFEAFMDIESFSNSIFKKRLLKELTLKPTHPYYKVKSIKLY